MSTPEAPARPIRRRLSVRKRLAFSLVLLLLVVFVIELGSWLIFWLVLDRSFSPSELQKERADVAVRNLASGEIVAQVHPYVGYVETPREDSGAAHFDSDRPIPVSKYGYIDDKDPIQKRKPDRVIIGIEGGSVAANFAVNGAPRLAERLKSSPEFAGKTLVFVNLALGGYKEPQQLMTLSYLLSLGAEFDIIINLDGFNEVALYEFEDGGRHVFPAYPRSWLARVEVAYPKMGRMLGKVEYLRESRVNLAKAFSKFPLQFSVAANLLWISLDKRKQQDIFRLQQDFRRELPLRSHTAILGPETSFTSKHELYTHLVDLWDNSSVQLARLCKANGIRYYQFLQPNQYVANSKTMSADERRDAYLEEHPYRRAVTLGYPMMIERGPALAAKGVDFHDLTRAFVDVKESIYVDSCCHYNKRGYEIVADRVADAILKQP